VSAADEREFTEFATASAERLRATAFMLCLDGAAAAVSRATGVVRETSYRQNPELRLTMLDALAQLPERDRAIVILRYFEDYSVEQTADVLEVPVSVVESQTRRSLEKLRTMLEADQLALFG
jgi:RNA polymerase sigma factor (sigma-70 family)